jgi:hypothetical protein
MGRARARQRERAAARRADAVGDAQALVPRVRGGAVARRLRMPPYYSYVVSARRAASARSHDSSITSTIGPQS